MLWYAYRQKLPHMTVSERPYKQLTGTEADIPKLWTEVSEPCGLIRKMLLEAAVEVWEDASTPQSVD